MTDQQTYDAAAGEIRQFVEQMEQLASEKADIPLVITYKNWRGEISERRLSPIRMGFFSTRWHPEPQWMLTAMDLDKGEVRDFALADFGAAPDLQAALRQERIARLSAEARGEPMERTIAAHDILTAERGEAWRAGAEAMRKAGANSIEELVEATWELGGLRDRREGLRDAIDAIRDLPVPDQPKEGA